MKLKTVGAVLAGLGFAGALVLAPTAAMATTSSPYVTVAWAYPGYPDIKQPQPFVASVEGANLNAFDSYIGTPQYCGGAYQIDIYKAVNEKGESWETLKSTGALQYAHDGGWLAYGSVAGAPYRVVTPEENVCPPKETTPPVVTPSPEPTEPPVTETPTPEPTSTPSPTTTPEPTGEPTQTPTPEPSGTSTPTPSSSSTPEPSEPPVTEPTPTPTASLPPVTVPSSTPSSPSSSGTSQPPTPSAPSAAGETDSSSSERVRTVKADTSNAGELAYTGSVNWRPFIALSLLICGIGVGLVFLGKRIEGRRS